MNKRYAFLALTLVFGLGAAQAAKPCEELKSEIAAKLDEKGVQGYTLEIVATDKVGAEAKVVGSCDGGSNKITYARK
ncbi:DUF1161 domain-containing protein [Paucibacter sp. B2R-40]|uniref:DUF1161 domain-containing protein n=1 Tax=Paucibacter sp. B2R-40 TaxID=2893554 RepID=UPI0021E4CC1A|nr:DUF1161 domain-containing protein [Paucibacter sp. B2R-40]MCV2352671.1 DUF1161 domain-containing protein [Paucibacter sp. B2R-40]